MDYKTQKDLHDRFAADTGLKLCIGNAKQYEKWLEEQAVKLFAVSVVVVSEAEVCCDTCIDHNDGECLNGEPCINFSLWIQQT